MVEVFEGWNGDYVCVCIDLFCGGDGELKFGVGCEEDVCKFGSFFNGDVVVFENVFVVILYRNVV